MKLLSLKQYGEMLDLAKSRKSLHVMLDTLREHKFVFITDWVIKELNLPILVQEEHHEHDFMVIESQGEYDVTLAFGVKLNGKLYDTETESVHIYVNGVFFETIDMPHGRKTTLFRKPKKNMIFPDDLTYDQRAELRKEHLRLNGPRCKVKPSEFYLKHWPRVKILDPNAVFKKKK
jgi:hypothetical protein